MDPTFVNARHAIARVLTSILCVAICSGVLAVPIDASAQVVTPRTLPVLQSGQFDMLPSDRAGMGGATIAVYDSLIDPFVNPAKATRIGASHIFSAPFFHSISGARGGGRSLPLGGGGPWGAWSATGLFTFQQLDRATPTIFFGCPVCAQSALASQSSTSGRSAYNQYVAGSIARRVTPSTSVGLGVQLAALDAIDGVDLLYAGSDRIDQSGSLADFRFGVTKELGTDRHLEVMLVHARTDMTHDVRFTTFRWDPLARQYIQEQRTDHNQDRTHIWGLHSEYSRPLGSEGWHLGWLGTVNHLSHPKIPNYVIQNIPRDPGTTYSFNAGAGVGRTVRGASFAADLIYEPMFADTWATAANDTAVIGCHEVCLAGAGTVKAGAKTVENTFRFNNIRMRLGAGQEIVIPREGAQSSAIRWDSTCMRSSTGFNRPITCSRPFARNAKTGWSGRRLLLSAFTRNPWTCVTISHSPAAPALAVKRRSSPKSLSAPPLTTLQAESSPRQAVSFSCRVAHSRSTSSPS